MAWPKSTRNARYSTDFCRFPSNKQAHPTNLWQVGLQVGRGARQAWVCSQVRHCSNKDGLAAAITERLMAGPAVRGVPPRVL